MPAHHGCTGANRHASALPWRVQKVAAFPGYRLSVWFFDGLSGIVDMSALIASPQAGVFATLRDRAVFDHVHIEFGTIVWPGDLDIAPDAHMRRSRSMANGGLHRQRGRRATGRAAAEMLRA